MRVRGGACNPRTDGADRESATQVALRGVRAVSDERTSQNAERLK